MTAYSILYREPAERPASDPAAPPFFRDLNLDQIVAGITAGREQYNLQPFFHAPLAKIDAIYYRHEVMRDLEQGGLLENVKSFAFGMRTVREHLAQAEKLLHPLQKQQSFLDAAEIYCGAVTCLLADLSAAPIASRGLRRFSGYVRAYAHSPRFTALHERAQELSRNFASIVYGVLIQGVRVDARRYTGETDSTAEVLEIFDRFKQDAVQRFKFDFSDAVDVNHIEG